MTSSITLELDEEQSKEVYGAIRHVRSNYLEYASKKRAPRDYAAQLRKKAAKMQAVLDVIQRDAVAAAHKWTRDDDEE